MGKTEKIEMTRRKIAEKQIRPRLFPKGTYYRCQPPNRWAARLRSLSLRGPQASYADRTSPFPGFHTPEKGSVRGGTSSPHPRGPGAAAPGALCLAFSRESQNPRAGSAPPEGAALHRLPPPGGKSTKDIVHNNGLFWGRFGRLSPSNAPNRGLRRVSYPHLPRKNPHAGRR